MIDLRLGDCLEILKTLPDNSVDSIVTDPPYGIGFMNKEWDSPQKHKELIEREAKRSEERFNEGKSPAKGGFSKGVQPGLAIGGAKEGRWFQEWCELCAAECFRVLKPGGHILSFSAPRTYHRMATAFEEVGFQVRDQLMWVFGSGFPKSHNIGKAIDKMGIENELQGWGTALKPAHEPICMARKPIAEKTVAENCLKWGTGGVNIDESRVEAYDGNTTARKRAEVKDTSAPFGKGYEMGGNGSELGRFPANLIHDNSEEVRECFPETKSGWTNNDKQKSNSMFLGEMSYTGTHYQDNSGNASRFFKSIIYKSKASKSERNKGCEEQEVSIHYSFCTMTDKAIDEEPITQLARSSGGTTSSTYRGHGETPVANINLS